MIHPEIDELVGENLPALSASHSRRQISCKLLVLCFRSRLPFSSGLVTIYFKCII